MDYRSRPVQLLGGPWTSPGLCTTGPDHWVPWQLGYLMLSNSTFLPGIGPNNLMALQLICLLVPFEHMITSHSFSKFVQLATFTHNITI